MPRATWVTQREFARRKGVSHTLVAKGIKSGRILANPEGKINWDTQSARWDKEKDPSKVRGIVDAGTPASGRTVPVENPVEAEKQPGTTSAALNYATAKTASETFKAKMMQIEYEKTIGELVSRADVKSAVFVFARTVRESIMNLPDRVAAESAAEIITFLRPLITDVVGETKASEVLEKISLTDMTRIMHRLWDREGRYVLEHLEKGADI